MEDCASDSDDVPRGAPDDANSLLLGTSRNIISGMNIAF